MSYPTRLDLSFLTQGLKQLDLSLSEYAAEPDRRAYRDSVIIHFLLTYELSVQAMKRFLELESLTESDVPGIGLQNIIRRADAHGLLRTGWPDFAKFRDARNAVAHTYNEQRALIVAELAKDFALEARYLLQSLERQLTHGK